MVVYLFKSKLKQIQYSKILIFMLFVTVFFVFFVTAYEKIITNTGIFGKHKNDLKPVKRVPVSPKV